MCRSSLLVLLMVLGLVASPAFADEGAPDESSGDAAYIGGRGLITLEGISGMFLNPTSGTLPQGTLTAQYCAAVLRQNGDNEVQHTAMISYGVTDWLEVGGFGRVSDLDNTDTDIGAGGPLVRVRLLKDESWHPEVSVGAMSRNGSRALDKHTLFLAASKRFALDEDGIVRAFRLHGGVRQVWFDNSNADSHATFGFVGGEIELPHDLYVVSEVSTNGGGNTLRTPFSIGGQWRPASHLGLSLAAVQTGGEQRLSLYAGIGISFDF